MTTTTSAFIPFSLLLADAGLWSSEIAGLGDESILDDVGVRDTGVESTPTGIVARFTLVLDEELAIPLFGVEGCAVVLGAGVTGQTELNIEIDLATKSVVRFIDVEAALRFPPDMLRPVTPVDGVFQPDPARPYSEIAFTASVEIGDQAVRLLGAPTLALGTSMIGDSGVVVDASDIELYLDGVSAPPGQPTGWRGVHLGSVTLSLPRELAEVVGALSLTDAYLGTGGFTGSVATDWSPALSATLGGLALTLEHAEVAFIQNALTAAAITGSVTVPFFDEPADVTLGMGLDGSLAIALTAEDGLYEFTKPDLLTMRLDSLGFEVDDDLFRVSLSGELTPLVGGLDWPGVEVSELSIDSDGNVRLAGGWLDLPSQFVLDFHGFQLEITKIGFGRTDDGGRWIGFSGALQLVDGMPAGASVDGLRITWYTDGRPVAISLDGVGVTLTIPGVLEFDGFVAYHELPGPVHRFDGDIRLALTAIGLEIDGQLVIGYDDAQGYPFFAIFLDLELPAGIPLGSTGLGLYGLAGLFGANMEPGKLPDEPWYGLAPGEGWYKRDPIGVAELVKWTNTLGSIALGAGVTVGTVADNGFTFAGRFLLAIVLPGPVILLEGKANILKERTSLSEDPLLRAIMVVDGRDGSFEVGIDAHYAFDDSGAVIDIGGGVDVFFPFDDPTAWHLYLGEKDPVERRIRASVFDLFTANAYFMVDARQIATGAWIGFDESWKFGPVGVALSTWISGDAVLSFKPPHFSGELWLHGDISAKVFGFGFDLGADARVIGEVADPFQIEMDLAFHLKLSWPLPSVDVPLTLRWGPTPTPPPLPLPLKEVAVEHFLVTTSWPLPRTSTPALLTPDYDPDEDGFLDTPTAATEPDEPPVVPLDARPHLTFSRSVHDDALVGVNAQPPFPAAQPDPGWEWIGDPAANEGPVRLRTALTEIALERRDGTTWVTDARTATTPNTGGEPTLYGSWAPVPQLPGGTATPGTPPPAGNTKLWLWSKSAFDYTRTADGRWDDWFTGSYVGYPCLPVQADERFCCDFTGVLPGSVLPSPWPCAGHPEFELGWATPPTVAIAVGQPPKLLFAPGQSLGLRLGRTVKQVDLYLADDSGAQDRTCLDISGFKRSSQPNPWRRNGFQLEVFDSTGAPNATIEIATGAGGGALNLGWRLTIDLPAPADSVDVTLLSFAGNVSVEAYDASGAVLDTEPFTGPRGQNATVTVTTAAAPIESVAVIAPGDETYLVSVCAVLAATDIVVVPVDRAGRPGASVPVRTGVATVDGKNLAGVLVRGRGTGFFLRKYCVTVGVSDAQQAVLTAIGEHTRSEVARWSQQGNVLLPHSDYRIKIVTTLETRDFASDPAFNTVRTQTEYAYFRTEGPPGLADLSAPVNATAEESGSGLDDLSRYVAGTIPADGQRPVYRAYDTGAEFGVDYVDLMYRAGGRDLGLYVFDNNDRPARDVTGTLLALVNQWGVAETVTLSESDTTWISLINASTCVAIDTDTITHTTTLGATGQVLDADTVYQARLIPLLLHELFSDYPVGTTAAGTGAELGAGWQVRDMGTAQGPSAWVVGTGYVEQQSGIWGGSTAAASPNKPGTLLLRVDDTDNWTDYRLTAILTSLDDDAIGLVVRYRTSGHYLFAMDRRRAYRRLVLVQGTAFHTLAEDGFAFTEGSDYTVTIEAIGDRLRVYQDGELVFDVTDATLPQGGIGCYAWGNAHARFADIRVDDLRADAPVVYDYSFTTSRFTDFYHQTHSFTGESWTAPAVAFDASAAVVPTGPPGDAETRQYTAAASALGQAALAGTPAVEATVLTSGDDAVAVLLRTAEPIDWSRTSLDVATGPSNPMPDAVPATGTALITEWTPSDAVADDESVTVLLRDTLDISGHRLDYRTLPSATALPAGTELAAPDLVTPAVEGPPVRAVLFAPPLGGLGPFTVVDPAGNPGGPSAWAAHNGRVTQTGGTGAATPWNPVALPGTNLVGGDVAWRDVVVEATVRCGARGAAGVLFRWTGEANHYRFSLSAQGGYRRLVKCVGGAYTVLWEDTATPVTARDHAVVVQAAGHRIDVAMDGAPLVSVTDADLPSGRIGLYSWRCPTAEFADLVVSERVRRLAGFTVVDRGTPSAWVSGGGTLDQTASGVEAFAVTGSAAWTDVRVRLLLTADDPAVLGVAVRWRGPDDHMRFVLDGPAGVRRLIRVSRGVATELWRAAGPFPVGEWREVVVEAIGTRFRVLLDGTLLADLHDDACPAGAGAPYAQGPGRFAALTVAAAEPAWLTYHQFAADSVLAAGRRVRLFAGTEADLTSPPVTSEVRRFQGFAATDPFARRLPAEGVDLRLVTPDGEIEHAARFAATYAAAPGVRVLRAADGTGLVLVHSDGSPLPHGDYRLTFTYQRAGEPVLREAGDSSAEVAAIVVTV